MSSPIVSGPFGWGAIGAEWSYSRFRERSDSISDYECRVECFRFQFGPTAKREGVEQWDSTNFVERARPKPIGHIPDLESLRSKRFVRSPTKHSMERLRPTSLPNQMDPNSSKGAATDANHTSMLLPSVDLNVRQRLQHETTTDELTTDI
jgi:hypothetical protein